MKELMCPICKTDLVKADKCYKCAIGHTYDISKEGYANLLLVGDKKTKLPGDDKVMIKARHEFLGKNYYSALSDKINQICNDSFDKGTILDTGCGEGYYLKRLASFSDNEKKEFNFLGFDISKDAIKLASKNSSGMNFFISSSYRLPLKDESAHIALIVFAPFAESEIFRVLKKSGVIVLVTPGENHLMQLKKVLYEKEMEKKAIKKISKFEIVQSFFLDNFIHLGNKEDIQNLFKMTPYYYKSSDIAKAKINVLNNIDISLSFKIEVLKKPINY